MYRCAYSNTTNDQSGGIYIIDRWSGIHLPQADMTFLIFLKYAYYTGKSCKYANIQVYYYSYNMHNVHYRNIPGISKYNMYNNYYANTLSNLSEKQ